VDRQAANQPIDASTVLPSGRPSTDPVELREYLAGDRRSSRRRSPRKLMMYAVNRELEYFDMPQVRAVVRGAAKDQYTVSSIVRGIVRSDAFLKQGAAQQPAGRRSRQTGVGDDSVFIFKKHLSRRTVLKGAGVTWRCRSWTPWSRRHGTRADGGEPQASGRLLLHPARRRSSSTPSSVRGRSLDAERRGRQLQVERDHATLEPFKRYVSTIGNLENAASAGSVHVRNPGPG
jgi:hypothetical protein